MYSGVPSPLTTYFCYKEGREPESYINSEGTCRYLNKLEKGVWKIPTFSFKPLYVIFTHNNIHLVKKNNLNGETELYYSESNMQKHTKKTIVKIITVRKSLMFNTIDTIHINTKR